MTTNPDEFLFGSAAPTVKFDTPGVTVTGRIVDRKVNQQTDFKTGELLTWPSGDPRMQLIVTLQTDQRDPSVDDDDGRRRLFVKGKRLTEAVRDAVKAAGVKKLEDGGTLTVTYVRDGVPENKGISPPKEYTASYQPPAVDATSDYLGTAQPTQTPQPAPPPQPVAAASASAGNGGLTPEAQAALANLNPAALQALLAQAGQQP